MRTVSARRPRRLTRALGRAAALLALAIAPAAAQGGSTAAAPYHVVATHVLGGDGGWDYLALDSVGRRIFVARGDRVMVIDERSGKLLGEIPGLHRTHGIAFSQRAGHGFVSASGDSSVTMFDLKTLRILGSSKAAAGADALIFDPASGRVFSFNGADGSATSFDAVSGKKVGTVILGGRPEFAVSNGAGKIYVNLEDSSQVVEVDVQAMTVTRRWPLAPCESPSGLAIDIAHHRLFSGCENKVMAISDYTAGKMITTVPIGSGVDACRYDASTGLAFSSNGEGTITVVREETPDRFSVLQTLATAPGARTMEIDRATHQLFTVTARFGPAPAQATPENPRKRPPILPNSFALLVLGR
jgi:DNA-binding beta-propeller fold protein YncE